jgi:nitroreductase
MDLFDAIWTTRAMRRLDPDRPVDDADLLKIVEAATKAPSGSNYQPTRWLVVRDPDLKRKVGDVYRQCWYAIRGDYLSWVERDPSPESAMRVFRSAEHLADHMAEAPAMVLPCSSKRDLGAASSVFGAIQNLCLAARALGLGTTLTTAHRSREDEVRGLLGVPDDVNIWALIPVGYPLGRWGEAKRRPVREVTYWDQWKHPPPA